MTHKELIKIREDKKLTKGQFAALLGISAMMQGRYEGGKIKIPDHIAEKALALAAAKVIEDVAAGKKEEPKKEEPKKAAAKAVAKKVAKDTKKKVVKDAEKKVVKETVKAAAGAAAVKGAKKAATAKVKADVAKKAEKPKAAASKKKETVLYIESLMGGTITAQEILKRIPSGADEVYVKPGENKAYWVKGKKTGEIDLW